MLKRFFLLASSLLVLLFVTACGVVAAFIPDQQVENALGISGEIMEADLAHTEPEPFDTPSGQSVSFVKDALNPTSDSGYWYFPPVFVRKMENSDETIPIDPNELVQPLGFSRLIITKGTDDGLDFPDMIEVSGSFRLIIWDGFAGEANNLAEYLINEEIYNSWSEAISRNRSLDQSISGTLTFNKDTSSTCNTRKCTYRANDDDGTTQALGLFSFDKADLQILEAILQSGTNDNSIIAVANFSMTSNPAIEVDSTAEVIIDAGTSTVKF